jgi:predicted Fe-Mo cluster-binding NifX family protein
MKKVAIPVSQGVLSPHFGHCEKFAIIDVDDDVAKVDFIDPPVHQPGVYPRFLAELGVKAIIAGGMGQKASALFNQNNIEVIVGINNGKPQVLARMYLENKLIPGENFCDH